MGRGVRYLLAGLWALGLASPALADSIAPPRSWKQVAPGGRFVFVMLGPESVEQEAKHWNEETQAEIRQTYARSGMYRNDGSTEPLWAVDWYEHGVELASDGVHLVRFGPWPGLHADRSPRLEQDAISFYARNRLIRTYQISELVDDPDALPRSVSHFRWVEEAQVKGEFEYRLTTRDGNQFVFDIRTGEITSESRMKRRTRWGWWPVLGAIAVVLVAFFVAHRRFRALRV